jgi:glycosyltransferase involved in cell wall biosynthesis
MYVKCMQTLVPSAATRELMISTGFDPRQIGFWTRGVDTTLFAPGRRSTLVRERWRASVREPALLYVGRLSREKGLELLPEMLYRLRACGAPHRLVVAGDGPLRRWLMEQLPDAVFTGSLSREDVANVFASADLFVFPSTTDTAGNVVLEAQASGLPVVVSNKGGPREHMMPDVTGRICEGNDARAWATVVADLLLDPATRQHMSAAARQYALNRRWETALAGVYQAYRDAVREAPQASPARRVA